MGLALGREAHISQLVAIHQHHHMLPLTYALSHTVRNQSVKAPKLAIIELTMISDFAIIESQYFHEFY